MDSSAPKNKLIVDFACDAQEKQQSLTRHLHHLLVDFGDTPILIEVVAYGPGLDLLLVNGSKVTDDIASLRAKGVVFLACHNTMVSRGISEAELLPGISIVPAGVARIVKAQLEGSVYYKE